MQDYFYLNEDFVLESGVTLKKLSLFYQIYFAEHLHQKPVVWIVHALTGDTNVHLWWKEVFEKTPLGSGDFVVICVNTPGSCYGSFSPLTISPEKGEPYFLDFPIITTHDIARMFKELRQHLNIQEVICLIGASLGAQIALSWAALEPYVFQHSLIIAGNIQHSAWGIAFNEAQRMAIQADPTLNLKSPDGGKNGLKAARAIAMLSYRSYELYNHNLTPSSPILQAHPACTYQNHQGEKLANRFNAYTYIALTHTMDSHNLFRNFDKSNPLGHLQHPITYVGITSDLLFPLAEQQLLHELTPNSTLEIIESHCGHDAFLIEHQQMINIVNKSFYAYA